MDIVWTCAISIFKVENELQIQGHIFNINIVIFKIIYVTI
jgi:hypothetical protein